MPISATRIGAEDSSSSMSISARSSAVPIERRSPTGLDSYDIRILEELQADASRSLAEIGAVVNLSQNACWRRVRRLEDEATSPPGSPW